MEDEFVQWLQEEIHLPTAKQTRLEEKQTELEKLTTAEAVLGGTTRSHKRKSAQHSREKKQAKLTCFIHGTAAIRFRLTLNQF